MTGRCALLLVICAVPRLAAAQDGATVQAVAIEAERVTLDGRLDEAAWREAPVFTRFLQQVPEGGAAATERTDVRVVYDEHALYVGVEAHQSPGVPVIADELRRDAGRMHTRNDTFTVALDTFFDRRNGYIFIFNPLGAISDWAGWDEGRVWSQDWDTVWEVRTQLEPWGWSAEMRLPFSSVRFPAAGPQRWGITFRRIVLAKNEWSYSTRILPEWGDPAIGRFSAAGELTGLQIARRTMHLELTPYVLGSAIATACGPDGCTTEARRRAGLDAKYGVTSNLTLDLTYNTDFSQVEADEQQINFSRFSLFFPEKRQFFLEGKGIFDFGIPAGDYRLLPFFSRRIGLEGDQAVPITGGARLTGKAGPYAIGLLAIGAEQSSVSPQTTFGVARMKRDVFGRSSIGMIVADRRGAGRRNETWGVDAHFAFGRNAKVESFVARAWSPERSTETWARRLRLANEGDLVALEVDHLNIGAGFDPQIGFVRRRGIDRWFARAQLSPRPRSGPVRKVFGIASIDYVRDAAGHLESRDVAGVFRLEFHSADVVQVAATKRHDAPDAGFRIGGGLIVPGGRYDFTEFAATWTASPTRRASGVVTYRDGGFYGGTRRELVASSVLLKAGRHLQADLTGQWTEVRLPGGHARARLIGSRLNYSANTRLFSSALLQWNDRTHELDVNLRVDWMYRPASHLYVVYARTSDLPAAGAAVGGHSFVVKLTRLWQF